MTKKSASPKIFTNILHYIVIGGIILIVVFFVSSRLNKSSIPCANTISCDKSLELKVENNAIGIFENREIIPPSIDLGKIDQEQKVFGAATPSAEKRIYVDLTKQRVFAYEGENLYMEAVISSGKWYPTPTGEFTIWSKIRSTRMSGGTGSDYYDLPNVPYVMFFSNAEVVKSRGFSFHGAYWHDNFGHPMSHGCINMRNIDAQKLYQWADPQTTANSVSSSAKNPGTKVIIYGEAPL